MLQDRSPEGQNQGEESKLVNQKISESFKSLLSTLDKLCMYHSKPIIYHASLIIAQTLLYLFNTMGNTERYIYIYIYIYVDYGT